MIIGIDLGTTNSAVGIWRDGKAELIPNSLGHVLTPSAVSLDDQGELVVGLAARERQVSHPATHGNGVQALHGQPQGDHARKKAPVVLAGRIVGAGTTQSQSRRRSFSRRARDGRRHHGAGLLQRSTAPGNPARRPTGGPQRRAPSERADGRGAGVRHSSERHRNAIPGVRPGRRHVRRIGARIVRRRHRGSRQHRR